MPREPVPTAAADLAALPNLGPRSRAMLAAVGIRSSAQLRHVGAVAAYVKLKRHGGAGVSLNALYALAGALDGSDWRRVQRERKLELLLAVEDYERRHPRGTGRGARTGGTSKAGASYAGPSHAATSHAAARSRSGDELLALRNIGPAMRRDFELLGIRSAAQLARCSADALYARIQRLTGTRHDPCVWDTYAAAIHQAQTGEALAWWQFTPERKRRQQQGTFMSAARPAARPAALPAVRSSVRPPTRAAVADPARRPRPG